MAADTDACKGIDETLHNLLESGDFSDLTVTCKGTTFNVHKSVVCFQSSFFKNAVKQGAFKEGETGVVDLPDDDPDAVRAMLQFTYSRSYEASNTSAMLLHARTYCLALKLDLEHLSNHASAQLGIAMNESQLSRDMWARPSVDMWAATIREIYAKTASDDKIRNLIITGALRNIEYLFEYFEDRDNAFSTMMMEVGEFGMNIARSARFASDLQNSSFNPPLDGNNGIDGGTANFYCFKCHDHWTLRLLQGDTVEDASPRPCPWDRCRYELEPVIDHGCTLLHRWDCGFCGEGALWSSASPSRFASDSWYCSRCGDRNIRRED